MNIYDVHKINRNGLTILLYSHDDSFTRHVVEFDQDGYYLCRINEQPCFRRGTHDRMAKLHGFDLNQMDRK